MSKKVLELVAENARLKKENESLKIRLYIQEGILRLKDCFLESEDRREIMERFLHLTAGDKDSLIVRVSQTVYNLVKEMEKET